MKIRAQIGMVLNLDKCIGCHTCSVTCKNVWTSRPGMEYAWFNNVETKPGIGYPKEWENQDKWNGGWIRKANGSIEPRQGGKWKLLMKIFANPNLPQIDDYYEPFTFDYDHLQSAPEMKASADRRPRSLITGQRMDKIDWGPNWEEILGGEFCQARQGQELRRTSTRRRRTWYGQFENTFMMYLPRLCEHCLNPACVASLPLGLDLQARGRRHRADRPGQVPRLAHVRLGLPLQEDLLQLEERQGREVHLLLPAHRGRPAHGVLRDLRRPHPLPRRAAVRRRPHPGSGQRRARQGPVPGPARHLPRPERPEGDRAGARATASPKPGSKARATARSTRWRWTGRSRCRCTPSTARCRWSGTCRRCRRSPPRPTPGSWAPTARSPTSTRCASRCKYLANLLTAGDTAPVVRALERMLAMRAYQRGKHVDGETEHRRC